MTETEKGNLKQLLYSRILENSSLALNIGIGFKEEEDQIYFLGLIFHFLDQNRYTDEDENDYKKNQEKVIKDFSFYFEKYLNSEKTEVFKAACEFFLLKDEFRNDLIKSVKDHNLYFKILESKVLALSRKYSLLIGLDQNKQILLANSKKKMTLFLNLLMQVPIWKDDDEGLWEGYYHDNWISGNSLPDQQAIMSIFGILIKNKKEMKEEYRANFREIFFSNLKVADTLILEDVKNSEFMEIFGIESPLELFVQMVPMGKYIESQANDLSAESRWDSWLEKLIDIELEQRSIPEQWVKFKQWFTSPSDDIFSLALHKFSRRLKGYNVEPFIDDFFAYFSVLISKKGITERERSILLTFVSVWSEWIHFSLNTQRLQQEFKKNAVNLLSFLNKFNEVLSADVLRPFFLIGFNFDLEERSHYFYHYLPLFLKKDNEDKSNLKEILEYVDNNAQFNPHVLSTFHILLADDGYSLNLKKRILRSLKRNSSKLKANSQLRDYIERSPILKSFPDDVAKKMLEEIKKIGAAEPSLEEYLTSLTSKERDILRSVAHCLSDQFK
ncbi:MAG: hypothetical protein KBD63_01830 [Bacteriovoracaceae bacterium]|nr:hypothetical protein [Bacteriovoracaceae bacterium]